MFEYIDSDSLSTEDKILYLINDMEAADEKVEKAIEDLDAAVLTEREAE